MKTVSISGSLRKNVGKKDAKANRKQGKIPCVLYGGKEQIHFIIDEISFNKLIYTPEVFIIKININDKEYESIIQKMQFHPVSDKAIHVDFLEIIPNKPVIIKIPVKLEGNPVGIMKGGVLSFKIRKLNIKALKENLPENVVINIDKLDIGDSIRVSDIDIKDVRILDIHNAVIVGVRTARAVVEEKVSEEEGEETTEETKEGEEGEEKEKGGKEEKGKGEKEGKGEKTESAPEKKYEKNIKR